MNFFNEWLEESAVDLVRLARLQTSLPLHAKACSIARAAVASAEGCTRAVLPGEKSERDPEQRGGHLHAIRCRPQLGSDGGRAAAARCEREYLDSRRPAEELAESRRSMATRGGACAVLCLIDCACCKLGGCAGAT
eukprot:2921640-Pleurochrysis_carterae.AAC.2